MGGLHSGETGPPEMLMELVYRLVTETSPLVTQIRDNVIVSMSPVADPDGRDRNLDWFYRGLEQRQSQGTPVANATAAVEGTPAVTSSSPSGAGTAAIVVAHFGSNNMIRFRYRLERVPMRITEKPFKAGGTEFPAGSFVVTDTSDLARIRIAVEELGLTASMLASAPQVPMHDADVPRIAMYSPWNGTQDTGWVRFAFDQFGIPYDLISAAEWRAKGWMRLRRFSMLAER